MFRENLMLTCCWKWEWTVTVRELDLGSYVNDKKVRKPENQRKPGVAQKKREQKKTCTGLKKSGKIRLWRCPLSGLGCYQWRRVNMFVGLGLSGSNMYSQSQLRWHFRMLFQSSKLKVRMSLSTESWQKRRSSFELWVFENDTPSGIDCTTKNP